MHQWILPILVIVTDTQDSFLLSILLSPYCKDRKAKNHNPRFFPCMCQIWFRLLGGNEPMQDREGRIYSPLSCSGDWYRFVEQKASVLQCVRTSFMVQGRSESSKFYAASWSLSGCRRLWWLPDCSNNCHSMNLKPGDNDLTSNWYLPTIKMWNTCCRFFLSFSFFFFALKLV